MEKRKPSRLDTSLFSKSTHDTELLDSQSATSLNSVSLKRRTPLEKGRRRNQSMTGTRDTARDMATLNLYRDRRSKSRDEVLTRRGSTVKRLVKLQLVGKRQAMTPSINTKLHDIYIV